MRISRVFPLLVAFTLSFSPTFLPSAMARSHAHRHHTTHTRSSGRYHGAVTRNSRHHGLHDMRFRHGRGRHKRGCIVRAVTHYAYPSDFFMWSAPEAIEKQLPSMNETEVKDSFANGEAGKYSPSELVDAGVFVSDPLRGGIFQRREDVKYIILHSTETGRVADAQRVIRSWNRGMRHPGAQYIVDRDGTIYQTVDPQYGTVHVNIFRTLFGVDNDNSVGIEIVRAGDQQYTQPQLDSVTHLVVYLQIRFKVADDHIYSHHQVQPSDRLDPVGWDWNSFNLAKASLRDQTVAVKRKPQPTTVVPQTTVPAPPPTHMTEPNSPEAWVGMIYKMASEYISSLLNS